MPKRRKRKKTSRQKNNFWEEYKKYIIPSIIGAAIAWFFSASLFLGISVFIAVWIGNWIGYEYLASKK